MYEEARRTSHPAAVALDEERVKDWKLRARDGEFLTRSLTFYFIWDPETHRRMMASAGGPRPERQHFSQSFSLSRKTCITRARAQHEAILAQFGSILRGVESSMVAADFEPVRMSHEEMFPRNPNNHITLLPCPRQTSQPSVLSALCFRPRAIDERRDRGNGRKLCEH